MGRGQYDAFLSNDFREFDKERKFFEFRVRDPSKRDYKKTSQKLYDILTGYQDDFTLSFDDPDKTTIIKLSADPKVNKRQSRFYWAGVTWEDKELLLNVTLSIWNYKALLRNDLTPSDRMATQLLCAKVIIHELSVRE